MARAAKLVGAEAAVEAVYVLKVPGQLPLDGGLEAEEERAALADGAAVARAWHHRGLDARHIEAAAEGRTLRADQRAARKRTAQRENGL